MEITTCWGFTARGQTCFGICPRFVPEAEKSGAEITLCWGFNPRGQNENCICPRFVPSVPGMQKPTAQSSVCAFSTMFEHDSSCFSGTNVIFLDKMLPVFYLVSALYF